MQKPSTCVFYKNNFVANVGACIWTVAKAVLNKIIEWRPNKHNCKNVASSSIIKRIYKRKKKMFEEIANLKLEFYYLVVNIATCRTFNSRIDITWNAVRRPTKWAESSLRQTLQVRVTSDTQKIQYSDDWLKWRCTLWRNVNFRIFVGHRTSFQAVCQYVNY